jgi:uncharacterized protein YjiS (DUF1127 family)
MLSQTSRIPQVKFAATRATALQSVLALLRLWWRRARTRRHLAALDSARLADIGLSESERRNECEKPFWRR